MFNSTTLEVAIGLALIYLIVSLFCTAVNEALAGMLNTRARNLERGIRSLFTEGIITKVVQVGEEVKTKHVSLTDAIYDHGLVQSLYRCSGTSDGTSAKNLQKPPSYIPSRTFASALYDILFANMPATTPGATPPREGAPQEQGAPPKGPDVNVVDAAEARLQGMMQALNALPDGAAKQAILTLVRECNGNAVKTRQAFEHWYDDGMDRAAGWFKKSTQMNLFLIGLAMAVVLNVDSIQLGRALWTTPARREFAVASADTIAKNLAPVVRPAANAKPADDAKPGAIDPSRQDAAPTTQNADAANAASSGTAAKASDFLEMLEQLDLPIGWNDGTVKWWFHRSEHPLWLFHGKDHPLWFGLFLSLFGWVLTAIAVTLGAPFWFDTLNQFMVVRSTIKPREKSEVEGSKDPTQK
ncbi:MAG TPA: hypothetical protein VGG85_13195 [Terracidiphilus sp.]|jgi:hypothetical protein